jgi:hypothetical protein
MKKLNKRKMAKINGGLGCFYVVILASSPAFFGLLLPKVATCLFTDAESVDLF